MNNILSVFLSWILDSKKNEATDYIIKSLEEQNDEDAREKYRKIYFDKTSEMKKSIEKNNKHKLTKFFVAMVVCVVALCLTEKFNDNTLLLFFLSFLLACVLSVCYFPEMILLATAFFILYRSFVKISLSFRVLDSHYDKFNDVAEELYLKISPYSGTEALETLNTINFYKFHVEDNRKFGSFIKNLSLLSIVGIALIAVGIPIQSYYCISNIFPTALLSGCFLVCCISVCVCTLKFVQYQESEIYSFISSMDFKCSSQELDIEKQSPLSDKNHPKVNYQDSFSPRPSLCGLYFQNQFKSEGQLI